MNEEPPNHPDSSQPHQHIESNLHQLVDIANSEIQSRFISEGLIYSPKTEVTAYMVASEPVDRKQFKEADMLISYPDGSSNRMPVSEFLATYKTTAPNKYVRRDQDIVVIKSPYNGPIQLTGSDNQQIQGEEGSYIAAPLNASGAAINFQQAFVVSSEDLLQGYQDDRNFYNEGEQIQHADESSSRMETDKEPDSSSNQGNEAKVNVSGNQ